jgi:DnaK suppressor protein
MTVQGVIEAEYVPHDGEQFMCKRQRDWFRDRLLKMKQEILDESRETVEAMQESAVNIPDLVDRASAEADRALELRTRDRQRKLISKIEAAIRRIDEGEYGYCEETGDPISLKRLIARPTATMSLEAQERHERREKVHRDD